MIVTLQGILRHIQPPSIILDVNQIGYELFVSMNTVQTLPSIGETTFLHTQLLIKEDAHLLFGFASILEKTVFNDLIKVSGVGAKTALAMLSGLSMERLCLAIEQKNIGILSSIPGIGAKTAERIALELAKKASKWQVSSNAIQQSSQHFAQLSIQEDAVLALTGLGYSEKDANKAIEKALAQLQIEMEHDQINLNHLIMQGLKYFAKN